MKEQNTTNNIIENKKIFKSEDALRDMLRPIISTAVNDGFIQRDLQKVVRELWQESNLKKNSSNVICTTNLELETTEEVFRKKAKMFIEKYGEFFILSDSEDKLFYENLFWSMYLSVTIKHSLKMETVTGIFLGNHYKYNSYSALMGVQHYKEMSLSLLYNFYVDKESNYLFSEKLPYTGPITGCPQYIELEKLLVYKRDSWYKQFALAALTCIINFV